MQRLVPRRVDREFAELICADEQWLRDEFDALVAASFGGPPTRPGPPAPPWTPPAGRPWRYLPFSFPAPPAVRRAARPAGSGLPMRRQRSPPGDDPVRVRHGAGRP
ncbi:hypothetical protein [Actinomadura sp. 6K520]|uniref:hypothetical protein n=1 Tax=Actinomadura sp. 6K520 TaxID=2530364 RepID=UPI001047A5B8|nr:hypothetical protein [Actinomadura sp. 6K520]TDE38704.1 hypothetical protein E1289_01700 [Actinomadura sp. 6K520]